MCVCVCCKISTWLVHVHVEYNVMLCTCMYTSWSIEHISGLIPSLPVFWVLQAGTRLDMTTYINFVFVAITVHFVKPVMILVKPVMVRDTAS